MWWYAKKNGLKNFTINIGQHNNHKVIWKS